LPKNHNTATTKSFIDWTFAAIANINEYI